MIWLLVLLAVTAVTLIDRHLDHRAVVHLQHQPTRLHLSEDGRESHVE